MGDEVLGRTTCKAGHPDCENCLVKMNVYGVNSYIL